MLKTLLGSASLSVTSKKRHRLEEVMMLKLCKEHFWHQALLPELVGVVGR